ncbi:NAD-dependent dehydratase [Vulcanimicrobium alpinum]|uniref:NAD-dependent dehydratase n=1 Tax=Vulcanimicrobium alpinum TaxID=3016050 RepID=A0AAN1XYD4_UNVUL|nr:NAD-dependent epimerase/dehydratase family protein [Vulcanimicrobium alpinum]BDE07670.1 NAD-dependent dehydratase [Vulcanimicrobium alpinum]
MLAYITGAAGFLGSHLVDQLMRDDWNVVGIDNLATGDGRNLDDARATARFTFVHADVSQPWREWTSSLATPLQRPDVVFHLASPASPVHYERLALETMAVNAVGTMHAVGFSQAAGSTLLYASTSESYGDPLEHPQRESYWGNVNPVGVRSCYDESKRYGEAYVTTAVRKLGIDARIVRIFNTYGPRMQAGDGRVIPNFCVSALRGEPLTVYGDGSQTRSFCYVDDLLDGIVRLATRPGLSGNVVNIGNPGEFTIRELAAIVAELAEVELRTIDVALPPDDPARRRPDITKARTLLEWEPKVALRDGLQKTLDFFRARADEPTGYDCVAEYDTGVS